MRITGLSTLIILLASLSTLFAQSQYVTAEDSDPQATKLLAKIGSQYNNGKIHQIDFALDIELPGQAKETQEGELIQDGQKFILDIEQRQIISDSETVWMFLKELNEVQVNDADFEEMDGFNSPADIFNLHESKDFVFAISSRFPEEGEDVTQIEAKPLDGDSEYSKMRLTVSDKGQKVKRLKIFYKDGSRFTMLIKKHNPDFSMGTSGFFFDASKHPGVHIEDLRF